MRLPGPAARGDNAQPMRRNVLALLALALLAAAGTAPGCNFRCSCGSDGVAVSTEPEVTVAGSSECDAWCNKVRACGSECDALEKCKVEAGSCRAAKRASLRCEADKGEWTCIGGGYALSSSCGDFDELCTGADEDTKRVAE